MIYQSKSMFSDILLRAVFATFASLLVASLSACITQLDPKSRIREIPGRFSGFWPTRFLLFDNSIVIVESPRSPVGNYNDEYKSTKICGVPLQVVPSYKSSGTLDERRPWYRPFMIRLADFDFTSSRQKVNVWLHSEKFSYVFPPPTLYEDPGARKVGAAEVKYDSELRGWKGTIVCNDDDDWYDVEFFTTHDATPYELFQAEYEPLPEGYSWINDLSGFQRQQVRRLADAVSSDEELAASILYDGCGRIDYGVFVIGASGKSRAIRTEVRKSEAKIIRESQNLCNVLDRYLFYPEDCKRYKKYSSTSHQNRGSQEPNTYKKPGAGTASQYLLVESPSFWEADLMISLLNLQEVVSVSTLGDRCGGGGFAEALVFVDEVFPAGRPSRAAISTFLWNVLNRAFSESIRDQRFKFAMYPTSSKWLRYTVNVSGPSHLVTFTPDNFWKRLEIEIILVNMNQGIAMLVSVPKAQRSYWDVDRAQGPPDTDYKPYDETDGDLSRVAGRIVATANTIIDVDYSRFVARP